MTGLGRRIHFDERSRRFSVAPLLAEAPRRQKVWRARWAPLDQGAEGSCVGHSWAGELAASPHRHTVTNQFGFDLYHEARNFDRLMGNHWDEGASILAGAKAAKASGLLSEYRWAFGIDQVVDTILQLGPVILGINWYRSMYSTGPDYLVDVSGDVVGGHAIMANGFIPNYNGHGPVIAWTNSWGKSYGRNGRGYIRKADLDRLLRENGEACIPVDTPKLTAAVIHGVAA